MLSFFKKLTGQSAVKRSAPPRNKARYEEEKKISHSGDKEQRLKLAESSKTHQEILFYLAVHDKDPEVRMAVACNISTPVQASVALAMDTSVDVRFALAQRLVRLLPELEVSQQSQIYAVAVQALGALALDEVLKIRIALSSTLKDYAHTPPKIAAQLARDLEREVSEPILRFCMALADEDLLDILKNSPAAWALQAVASRKNLSEMISHAIIESDNREAGVALLNNAGAAIGVRTLERIIDRARDYTEWQKPAALNKSLPGYMANKLAEFADASVRDILIKRTDFDQTTIDNIAAVFTRRLSYADDVAQEPPVDRARRMYKEGALTDEVMIDAMAMRDQDFVYAAIALKAGTSVDMVSKVFALKAPKPIVALCWKAELSMRTAFELQKNIGQVPPKELLYPRGGTDYPLSEEEILWQLDFLGLKAA